MDVNDTLQKAQALLHKNNDYEMTITYLLAKKKIIKLSAMLMIKMNAKKCDIFL